MKRVVWALLSVMACAESKTPRKPIETVPFELGTVSPPSSQGEAPLAESAPGLPNEATPVPAAPSSSSTGKNISNAECSKLLDHFFDLTLAADARAMGAPPEAVKQAKEMARGQNGDPCQGKVFTASQYQCGMKAKAKEAFEKCVQ